MLLDVGSAAAPHPAHHAVQFYANDHSLFATVAEFLSDGLILNQPAIVIGTPAHRDGIEEHLRDKGLDCALARRTGDLVMLDAEETLGQFMIGREIDPELFEGTVGTIVKQVLSGRGRTVVRAFGEMVDLLWRQGNTEGAIKLEILWHKLVIQHRFALLCGYAMGHFYKKTWELDRIRHHHTHAILPDNVLRFTPKRGG
jgi:DcmR-like sensory protein